MTEEVKAKGFYMLLDKEADRIESFNIPPLISNVYISHCNIKLS